MNRQFLSSDHSSVWRIISGCTGKQLIGCLGLGGPGGVTAETLKTLGDTA